MSSEKHPNLQLNKWTPSDYVKMAEFNENFKKIDDKAKEITDAKTDYDGVAHADLPERLTTDFGKVTSQLADITTINDHTTTYSYYPDGSVQTITEKDVSNIVVKTVTYTYNTMGDVTSSVTVMNGKTVTTTYTYDATRNVSNTVNVIS